MNNPKLSSNNHPARSDGTSSGQGPNQSATRAALVEPVSKRPASRSSMTVPSGVSDQDFSRMTEYQRLSRSGINEKRDGIRRTRTAEDLLASEQIESLTVAERVRLRTNLDSAKTAYKSSVANLRLVVSNLDEALKKQVDNGSMGVMFEGLSNFCRLIEERDGVHQKELEEKEEQLQNEKRWRDEAIQERDAARKKAMETAQPTPKYVLDDVRRLESTIHDLQLALDGSRIETKDALIKTNFAASAELDDALERALAEAHAQGSAEMEGALAEADVKAKKERDIAHIASEKALCKAASEAKLLTDRMLKVAEVNNKKVLATLNKEKAKAIIVAQTERDTAVASLNKVTHELQGMTNNYEQTLTNSSANSKLARELTTELEEVKEQIVACNGELEEQRAIVRLRDQTIHSNEDEINKQAFEIATLKVSLENSRSDASRHAARYQKLDSELERERQALTELLASQRKMQSNVLRQNKRISDMQEKLLSSEAQCLQLQATCADYNKERTLHEQYKANTEAMLKEQRSSSSREIHHWQIMMSSLAVANLRDIADCKDALHKQKSVIATAMERELRTDKQLHECHEQVSQLTHNLDAARSQVSQLEETNSSQSSCIKLLHEQVAECHIHRRLYLGGLRRHDFYADFRSYTKDLSDNGLIVPGLEGGDNVEFCLCILNTETEANLLCVVHRGDGACTMWFGKVADCSAFVSGYEWYICLGPRGPQEPQTLQVNCREKLIKSWILRVLPLETLPKSKPVRQRSTDST